MGMSISDLMGDKGSGGGSSQSPHVSELEFDSMDTMGDASIKALIDQWRERPLCFKSNGELIIVIPRDISYVESRGRLLKIHLIGVEEPVSGYFTIRRLRQLLPTSFVQCHKSYLVNLAHIFKLSGDAVVLRSGEMVPVSQRRRADLVKRIGIYARDVAE